MFLQQKYKYFFKKQNFLHIFSHIFRFNGKNVYLCRRINNYLEIEKLFEDLHTTIADDLRLHDTDKCSTVCTEA